MAVKPILFNGPMVRALLEGRKTMTRRVIRGVRRDNCLEIRKPTKTRAGAVTHVMDAIEHNLLPYSPGDLLWVREAWSHSGVGVWTIADAQMAGNGAPIYAVDGTHDAGCKFWPSIHMPRRFSRLTLEVTDVTDVKVERLQEITCADAIAEGFHAYANSATIDCDTPNPRDDFRSLWDGLNEKRGFGWDANPWVVAITFTVHSQNVDEMTKQKGGA